LNKLSAKAWSPEGRTTDGNRLSLNADEPILVTPEGIEIDVRGELAKALAPMFNSPEGSVIDERDVQLLKIKSFKIVIELGIVIDVRAVQSRNTLSAKVWSPVGRTTDENSLALNADEPILVTPEGIEMDVREAFVKALAPIFTSPEGSITDERDVQPLNIRSFKIVIALGILIDVREAQLLNTLPAKVWSPVGRITDENGLPLNAPEPILITPEGIEMDVREQPAKAVIPILKIPEGRDTEVSAVQPTNADC
jgi:SepF-like predicted cell division protein (DUF552 family)